jgi:hypothetical protein
MNQSKLKAPLYGEFEKMVFETNFICNFCVGMPELPRKYNSPYLSPHISKWN